MAEAKNQAWPCSNHLLVAETAGMNMCTQLFSSGALDLIRQQKVFLPQNQPFPQMNAMCSNLEPNSNMFKRTFSMVIEQGQVWIRCQMYIWWQEADSFKILQSLLAFLHSTSSHKLTLPLQCSLEVWREFRPNPEFQHPCWHHIHPYNTEEKLVQDFIQRRETVPLHQDLTFEFGTPRQPHIPSFTWSPFADAPPITSGGVLFNAHRKDVFFPRVILDRMQAEPQGRHLIVTSFEKLQRVLKLGLPTESVIWTREQAIKLSGFSQPGVWITHSKLVTSRCISFRAALEEAVFDRVFVDDAEVLMEDTVFLKRMAIWTVRWLWFGVYTLSETVLSHLMTVFLPKNVLDPCPSLVMHLFRTLAFHHIGHVLERNVADGIFRVAFASDYDKTFLQDLYPFMHSSELHSDSGWQAVSQLEAGLIDAPAMLQQKLHQFQSTPNYVPLPPFASLREQDSSTITECGICQETITRAVRNTACSHWFCHRCLLQWNAQAKPCPMCRTPPQQDGFVRGTSGLLNQTDLSDRRARQLDFLDLSEKTMIVSHYPEVLAALAKRWVSRSPYLLPLVKYDNICSVVLKTRSTRLILAKPEHLALFGGDETIDTVCILDANAKPFWTTMSVLQELSLARRRWFVSAAGSETEKRYTRLVSTCVKYPLKMEGSTIVEPMGSVN